MKEIHLIFVLYLPITMKHILSFKNQFCQVWANGFQESWKVYMKWYEIFFVFSRISRKFLETWQVHSCQTIKKSWNWICSAHHYQPHSITIKYTHQWEHNDVGTNSNCISSCHFSEINTSISLKVSRERERLSLSAFLRTEDIGVHIVHISRLIITYTLE